MGVLITPMALAHPLHPIKSRSRNKRRNLWVGWCVSSWRPWFWPVQSIYYIHITHYSRILTIKILFLRDIHTKSWYGHAGVMDDLILLGFRCAFSCRFQYCLCHGMDIGTCDIVHWSAAPHDCIANRTGFWCALCVECHQVLRSLFPRYNSISSWFSSWLLWLSLGFLWPLITIWSTL